MAAKWPPLGVSAIALCAVLLSGCRDPVVVLTKDNFEEKVLKETRPVLVDFWAEWCGPCLHMAPVIKKLAVEYEGKAIVAKVNIDEQRQLADRFDIQPIPAFLIFKDGKEVRRILGVTSKQALAAALDSAK